MRILYIHQHFGTRASCSGGRSYEFSRIFAERGHQVTVLCAGNVLSDIRPSLRMERFRVDGIDVIAMRSDYANRMGFFARMHRFVDFAAWGCAVGRRLPEVDVVFATSAPLTVGIPGMYCSQRFRVPLVFEVRDLWPEAPIQLGWLRNPLAILAARRLERMIYRRSTRIVALSPGMVDGIIATGEKTAKVAMIPNAADLDMFRPADDGADLRRQHTLEGRFVCLYAGALGMANNVLQVLGVCTFLRALAPSVMTVVAGDGAQKGPLEDGARKLGLNNLMVIGPRTRMEIADWVAAADMGLVLFDQIPILETNSPNKFFDYCAGGRPTLINIGGWIADAVEEAGAGVAVRDGDPGEMARAIAELASEPASVRQMGRNARKLAEERFDRKKLALELEEVLESAVRSASQEDGS